MADPTELARRVREHPGLRAKRDLAHVAAIVGGDGDDAALLPAGDGTWRVLAAEAIRPELIAADPYVAGIAGVVTVLNDVAATGGRPEAILDTVVGADAVVRGVLEGIVAAAGRYGVPVVGGHTTVRDGEPALATFAEGRARRPLRAAQARAGDAVCLFACLDGTLVAGPGGQPFFSHLRGGRGDRAAEDLALIADAADRGLAWAGRDVSMPGLVGSLVQFAEAAGRLGCAVDLDAIPVPAGVPLQDWLVAFPSFGFLLCGESDGLAELAAGAGVTCRTIGRMDATGRVTLASGTRRAVVWDLAREPLAALGA